MNIDELMGDSAVLHWLVLRGWTIAEQDNEQAVFSKVFETKSNKTTKRIFLQKPFSVRDVLREIEFVFKSIEEENE